MADLQAQIPKHIENELDDAFAPGGLLEGQHEQKIDIRSGCQFAAAPITARGRAMARRSPVVGLGGVIDIA